MSKLNSHYYYATASLITVLAVVSGPQAAFAQARELEAIVIEGTSLDSSGVPASSVGSAVTVVTGEQLVKQQIRHASDALRSLPGVSVSRTGSFGGITQIRLRGAEGNHVLVLIDGIEANDASDGEFDFSNLSADEIERIEVIRGPQSGLYGSQALAGVINIVTRTRKGPLQIRVKSEAGSFDTVDGAISVSGGNDKMYGAFRLHSRSSNGFNIASFGSETDEADLTTYSFKGGFKPHDAVNVDVVVRHVDKTAGSDPEGGAGTLPVLFDRMDFTNSETLQAGIKTTIDPFNGRWVQTLSADVNEVVNEFTIPEFAFFSRNDGMTRQLQYLNTFRFDTPGLGNAHHKITGLLEQEDQSFNPVTQDNRTRSREIRSYAGEYQGEFFNMLALQFAARHDDYDVLKDFDTWKAAGSLKVPRTTVRLHASTGTGVKAPTLFEQFGEFPAFFFVPNPNLVPEESTGWDAGVEVGFWKGRGLFDVTYFDADLQNKIARDPNANIGDPSLINLAGTSQRSGVEVALRVNLTERLEIGGAYTFLDATDPGGVKEIRRPEHTARADISFDFAQGRGNINGSIVYNGDMDDLAFMPIFPFGTLPVTLDEYVVVALAGSWELKPGLEWFGRIENLFDESYQEVFGYGTAGAAVYTGMRMKLGSNGLEK